ncbi:MAG: orotidine-5'-phosphate decarboxylase [Mariprofundales bacterium]|nr:orotidine-5'-phosphate decarboxylase [Mariprofundales bacterium]
MVALDLPDASAALAMRDLLGDRVGWFKIGLRLFVSAGPDLLRRIGATHRVFLDLKFHDIPNTVAQAVESAGNLGVSMVNVHAAGGASMLAAAKEASSQFPAMKLIAVTILTSDAMDQAAARELAVARAEMGRVAGLDGVVCSVHEVAAIHAACGADFLTVTPGIRLLGQDVQDQQRVADPAGAIAQGADYLVVGRPIIQAENPAAMAGVILQQMRGL